jgi:hypothetical protein
MKNFIGYLINKLPKRNRGWLVVKRSGIEVTVDDLGNLKKFVRADGSSIKYTHDDHHAIIRIREYDKFGKLMDDSGNLR